MTDNYTKLYIKKPIPIKAIQIDHEFVVGTLEGLMHGNAGDYIITGIHGEQYPCAKTIFEESYDEVHLPAYPIGDEDGK